MQQLPSCTTFQVRSENRVKADLSATSVIHCHHVLKDNFATCGTRFNHSQGWRNKSDNHELESTQRARSRAKNDVEAVPSIKIGHAIPASSAATFITHRATPWPLSDRSCRTLREPAVDRSEKIASLIALTLIAPEPRHAGRRTKLRSADLGSVRARQGMCHIR
jgi:hypothetical protein